MRIEMKTAWLVGLIVAIAPHIAFASDSDLKTEAKFDDSKIQILQGEVDDAALGNELESADNEGYRAAARQAKEDEKKLKVDLTKIEQQKKTTLIEKANLKSDGIQAAKSLEEQSKRNELAKQQLVEAQKEKAVEEQKTQKIKDELAKLQAQEKVLAEGRRKIQIFNDFARQERSEAIQRINTLRATQAAERRRQEAQLDRNSQYRKQTKSFEAQATSQLTKPTQPPSQAVGLGGEPSLNRADQAQ